MELRQGDMVWLETPKNPKCEVYDVAHYAAKCRAACATLAVDATFAPPPLQVRPSSPKHQRPLRQQQVECAL